MYLLRLKAAYTRGLSENQIRFGVADDSRKRPMLRYYYRLCFYVAHKLYA